MIYRSVGRCGRSLRRSLPPNAFHGRGGIARMKFSSGKLNVASRWKGPEGKHERAGRIVTGPNRIRFPGQRRKEKQKREREEKRKKLTRLYQAINSGNESTLLHRKNYLNALWPGCVFRFSKYDDERHVVRVCALCIWDTFQRYRLCIYIYIYIQLKILPTYLRIELHIGRCFRANRFNTLRKNCRK